MTRCRITVVRPRGLPRVRLTGTFASGAAAEQYARDRYPTAIVIATINLDRKS